MRGLVVKDGRAKRWDPRFASPLMERVAVSGLIPANKSGHDGYAAMPALCVLRYDQRVQAADSTCHCSLKILHPARKTALANKVSISEPE